MSQKRTTISAVQLTSTTVDCPELSDPGGSLAWWLATITALILQYGPDAKLTLDAGHNNICGSITHDIPAGVLNAQT